MVVFYQIRNLHKNKSVNHKKEIDAAQVIRYKFMMTKVKVSNSDFISVAVLLISIYIIIKSILL